MALIPIDAEFHRLVQEIAVWLGLEYERTGDRTAKIWSDDQDCSLYVSFYVGDKSLHISGNYPPDLDGRNDPRRGLAGYNDSLPSINCSMKRTATDIGKDIQRRFFPIYDPIVAKCRRADAATLQWRNKQEAKMKELIAACPLGKVDMKEHKIHFYETDVACLEVKVSSGVELKFDYLDVGTAKELLKIFYEMVEEKRARLAKANQESDASAV